MEKSPAQVRLSKTIARSGMTEAEVAAVLGVTQPTVSRLKNSKIAKVSAYQLKLDAHLGMGSAKPSGDLSELLDLAESSPALRDALIALQKLMQENA